MSSQLLGGIGESMVVYLSISAVYVSVGQSTGTLGEYTTVYRKSTAVYGSLYRVYTSLGKYIYGSLVQPTCL